MIKGVLFDMDGVLIDSERYLCEAAVRMFREINIFVAPDDFLPYVGTGAFTYLGSVAQKHGVSVDLEKSKKRLYEIYGELVRGRLLPMPGVHDFIEECKERNLKIALTTRADKVKMLTNLDEVDLDIDEFDAIVHGGHISSPGNHKEIILKAADKLDLNPSECIVVEDSIHGVQAAKEVGAKCLAITNSFTRDELDEAGADWIFSDLESVSDEVFDF
jgi:HAD superfamily hydrolase (TIGR01509 family)